MKNGLAELLSHMETLLAFLRRPDRILVPEDEALALDRKLTELIHRFKEADDRMVIGLVGGTGVGKSTLINALAGEEISSSTPLRPTTHHLVIYRHRDNPFSLSSGDHIFDHEVEALSRVSLVDFPDFDSIEPEHQAALARHFSDLDILLWVVDPIKYADQAFFDWLSLAPQAKGNNLFIFNKTDELEARYRLHAGQVIQEMVADFRTKLENHAGLLQPDILAFSALQVLQSPEGSIQKGFEELTARIRTFREEKLRRSIKALNLTAMARQLTQDLVRAANPDRAEEGLVRLNRLLDQQASEVKTAVESESRRIGTTFRRFWRDGMAAEARDQTPWPLNFILFIWDGITRVFGKKTHPVSSDSAMPTPDLEALTQRLKVWSTELPQAFSHRPDSPGRVLARRLSQDFSAEETAAAAAADLTEAAMEKSRKLKQTQRWRIRHHILPLLVLLYPMLPLAVTWFWPDSAGGSAGTPDFHIELSAKDLWSVIEILLGLYVLETIYFTFSLERAADRSVDRIVSGWTEQMEKRVKNGLVEPTAHFGQALSREINQIRTMSSFFSQQD